MDDTFAENLSKEKINTLEEFKDIASGLGKDRCKGLEIDSVENTIVFRLSRVSLVPELIKAFSEFTALINALAKTLKRTSFKQTQEENPKYALRTWLIRLGMNGEKYKDTRKLMLGHLNGSSAFRTVIEDE
ncbi:MAG TPA: hypothetical protein PLT58_06785 [Atribacterota bacterium]|nr:hypothetical protein [Atribacterota bacterium]